MKNQYSENGDITEILDSFGSYLSQKGRSENTKKTYCGVLQSFFIWLESHGKFNKEVNKEDVQAYISHLQGEQRSFSTIKKIINTINTYAKSINRLDLTQDIQYEKGENDKAAFVPEILSEQEVKNLLNEIEAAGNKRNTAIIYTLLETGIRVSELCSLNTSDLKLNEKNQTGQLIIRSKQEANNRTIPLTRSVVQHLKEYLNSRDDQEEALFLSNYQKRIAARTVQHTLKQFGVHPHKLRHTFCYNLVQKGLDLSIVAQLAGHSDTNLIKQYLKFEMDNNTNDEKYA
ncbi:tyrosine-type recombinase/integrase [Alkalihalobacterium chitinilyticum]|uniref:Tyrosine-type recombinase/integrase n=1 Tax=Alkalihalobacterium chitinilyticum TaxID=2980103 RepID=A0ABT5VNM1_9BACI|nr:tyrosine-type recombinase/integrase [Alkalihalobacterium chitinilyticum]MDE5416352.1 tyrosine-type recombinase/integrase [Alkalihalobacterium chitinilyticum]